MRNELPGRPNTRPHPNLSKCFYHWFGFKPGTLCERYFSGDFQFVPLPGVSLLLPEKSPLVHFFSAAGFRIWPMARTGCLMDHLHRLPLYRKVIYS